MNKDILIALMAGATVKQLDEIHFEGHTLVIDDLCISALTMDIIADTMKRANVSYGGSFIIEYLPETRKARVCIPEVKI